MHFRVYHHGRRWPRPDNHLDGRVCPECAVTVHGNRGQAKHFNWHIELAEVMNSVSSRAGVDEDEGAPMPWTADISSDEQPLEIEA